MADFNLVSEFKPAGDQAQAIDALVQGIENKEKHQTLLGITLSLIHISEPTRPY